MRRNIIAFLFVTSFLLPLFVSYQDVLADENVLQNLFQPESAPESTIDGFRSAKFGMDEAALRSAIAKDFPSKVDKINSEVHMLQKTKVLSVVIEDIIPDAGVAVISYVIGYNSQKLIHVGITWNGKEQEIGSAAIILRDYFSLMSFARDKVVSNVSLPNGSMLVFRGSDKRGRMVSVLLQKISQPDKPDAGSSTRMELSYAENPEHPDIFTIKPGDF